MEAAVKPHGHCVFSPNRAFRYVLWRVWDAELPYCQFIGLNPSVADETQDDPTIRRCIRYAKDWGYGALVMTNAFGFRATDPKNMMACSHPIGADNDKWIVEIARGAGIVVAAWGNDGAHLERSAQIRKLDLDLHALKLTGSGEPGHPLYLKASLRPFAL